MLQVVDKNSQNAVNSAAKELRRNYSKKVADKLSLLTKNSLKILSKHFASASSDVKSEVCGFHNNIYFLIIKFLAKCCLHLLQNLVRVCLLFDIGN